MYRQAARSICNLIECRCTSVEILLKYPLDKREKVCYNKYCKYFKCVEGKKDRVHIFREPLFGAKRQCVAGIAPPRAEQLKVDSVQFTVVDVFCCE